MLLSLYAASAVLPLAIVVFMIVHLILRGRGQVILCTECQQCRPACPLLEKGCNPVDLILASKAGRDDIFLRGGAELCVACGKCEKACPRGLAPHMEVLKWKDRKKVAIEKTA
jgi:Fe-S oxidoreductase